MNDRLTTWVELQRTAFDDGHPANVSGSELNLSWEVPLLTERLVAVRMKSRITAGGVVESVREIFYADRVSHRVWTGADLVAKDRLEQFAKAVEEKLSPGQVVARQEMSPVSLLSDPRFNPDGALTLRLSRPETDQRKAVRLDAETVKPWLSAEGRVVKRESRSRAPGKGRGSTRPKTSQRSSAVNCAVEKCVALTFDDGPGEYTGKLLDDLKRAKAPATFFVLGQQVRVYPKLIRRMVAEDHQVANHTYDHRELTRLSPAAQRSEVERGRAELRKAGAPKTKLLRPPYGAYNATTQTLGQSLILWDVDTLDWQNRSKATTTNRAMNLVKPGSIILMHDIHPSSVRATPGLIKKLRAQGYTLVTIDTLLGQTKKGKVYQRR